MPRTPAQPLPPLTGRDLRLVRRARDLTLERLSAATGLHIVTLSQIERGHRPLSQATELRLVRALWGTSS